MDKTFNWASAIPWVISIVAIAVGIWQYTANTMQANRVPFLQKQLEVVLAAVDTAGELTSYKDPDKWTDAYERFRILYVGKLDLVEDAELAQTVKKFNAAIERGGPPSEVNGRRSDLLAPAIELDHAARAFLLKSWGVDLKALNNDDDPNAPDPKLSF